MEFFYFKIFRKKNVRFFNLLQLTATHECPQNISAHSVQPFGRPKNKILKSQNFLYKLKIFINYHKQTMVLFTDSVVYSKLDYNIVILKMQNPLSPFLSMLKVKDWNASLIYNSWTVLFSSDLFSFFAFQICFSLFIL